MGISRSPRTLTLDEPLDVEVLWQRLARALPPLVRMFVPLTIDERRAAGLATAPLPALRGPTHLAQFQRRRYDCAELGSFGQLDLYDDDPSLSLCVTQRTVSNGLSVLELWSTRAGERIAELSVGCHVDRFEAVFAVLRAALATTWTSS